MQREEPDFYLDGLLEISRLQDYCLNALQVEGRRELAESRRFVDSEIGFCRGLKAPMRLDHFVLRVRRVVSSTFPIR